jgi:hypothetical protein
MTETNITKWTINVVRGCDFEATQEAAEAGDKKAQEFLLAFAYWDKSLRHSDASASCFSCAEMVTPKNFGGIGVARQTTGGDAYVGAFCSQCQSKGFDILAFDFSDWLSELTGTQMVALQ